MANNLALNIYDVGGDYDSWGDKIIADHASIGSAFGDTATIAATGGSVALSQSQSNAAFHRFTGVLTSNLVITPQPGIGREWTVINATTGAFTLTYQGSGGSPVGIAQGKQAKVRSDGAVCTIFDLGTMSGALGAGSVQFAALADVSNNPTLVGNSQTKVPTEFAVKSYADNLSFSSSLPGMAGNAGKVITTDGTTASWTAFPSGLAYLANDQLWTKPQRSAVTTLVSGTSIPINAADNNDFELLLAHSGTIENFQNAASHIGQKGAITGQQNATGGYSLAFGSNWLPIGSATAPPVPLVANAPFRVDYHIVSGTRTDYMLSRVGI